MKSFVTFFLVILLAWIYITLCGCAALVPDKLITAIDHTSHIEQHFGEDPTDYGYNTLELGARWERGNTFVEVTDGRTIRGTLDGMHEVFNARIGYSINLKDR
jgi:hypothetical protein